MSGEKIITEKSLIDINPNIKLKVPTYDNPDGVKYYISDVIIHEGVAVNGHYYTTHFKENTKKWEMVNDDKCEEISEEEANKHNKHGVIYVLKKDSTEDLVDKHNPSRNLNYGNDVMRGRTVYNSNIGKDWIDGINETNRLLRRRRIFRRERREMEEYMHSNSFILQNNELLPERRFHSTEDTSPTATNPWSSATPYYVGETKVIP